MGSRVAHYNIRDKARRKQGDKAVQNHIDVRQFSTSPSAAPFQVSVSRPP